MTDNNYCYIGATHNDVQVYNIYYCYNLSNSKSREFEVRYPVTLVAHTFKDIR